MELAPKSLSKVNYHRDKNTLVYACMAKIKCSFCQSTWKEYVKKLNYFRIYKQQWAYFDNVEALMM